MAMRPNPPASGAGLSCLDLLTTPGFVWGATGPIESTPRPGRDACARGAESSHSLPLGTLLQRFKI